MFNTSVFFVAALVISVACDSVAAQKVQTVFNLEEPVRREATIPASVIAVLKSDRRVDQCFQQKGADARENEWFAASEIDLNGDRRWDLIIKAKDACLYGANQGPFWIFQNAADGYQQVLSAHGLQLAVAPKKTNSFYQVKIGKVIGMKPAFEVYSFRTGKYRLSTQTR